MPTYPPPVRRRRRQFGVDPEDRRQEQAGYPLPPASPVEALREDMLGGMKPGIDPAPDRFPNLNQPVPRAGMEDFDREQATKNAQARRIALQPSSPTQRARMTTSPLRGLKSFLGRRHKTRMKK